MIYQELIVFLPVRGFYCISVIGMIGDFFFITMVVVVVVVVWLGCFARE